MIKYYSSSIVFQEVPDEITLALEITGCPHRCPECHSPWLQEPIGRELTREECSRLISSNPGITCVCFMGGDRNHSEIAELCKLIHFKGLKTAIYSGDEEMDPELIDYMDYYKIGPYIKELGPLNAPTTNQRFYRIENSKVTDLTKSFLPKKLGK